MVYKFRAWDKKQNRMINADSLAFEEYEPLCMQLNSDNLILMPYINFNDKNEKEIYVGDIIKFQDISGEGEDAQDIENIATVIIEYGRVGLTNFKYGYGESTVYEEADECWDDFIGNFECGEVIGNIYENKDLLSQQI